MELQFISRETHHEIFFVPPRPLLLLLAPGGREQETGHCPLGGDGTEQPVEAEASREWILPELPTRRP